MDADDRMKALVRRLDRAVVASGGTSLFAIKGWHWNATATRYGDRYTPRGWVHDRDDIARSDRADRTTQ